MTIEKHIFRFKVISNIFSNKMFELDHTQGKTTDIEEQVLRKVDEEMLKRSTMVLIEDDLTKESQTFKMVKNQYGEMDLLTINNQVIGLVRPWIDESIPQHLKSKEGVILDPHTGDELLEWIIINKTLTTLPLDVYREYKYLENHQSLQESYQVDYSYI